MSNERIIPVDGDSVVTYTLLADGQELPLTYELLSIVTHKEVNRIPWARIVFRDGSADLEDFELSNKSELIPGKTFEIQVGYASKDKTIFKGIIVKHGIKISASGDSVLVVECRDEAVKMTIGRKNAYYVDKKDSDVMSELIEAAGLKATTTATTLQHKELIQYYSTDWDFLLSRADANGQVAIATDGEVIVKKPEVSGAPVLSVVYGDTIYEFEAEMDARYQLNAVKSNAWDYKTQKLIEKSGAKPAAYPQGNVKESVLADVVGLSELILQHPGHVVDEELKAWADAELIRSHMAKIIGRVKIQGFPELLPGDIIEINGVGERFNGKAYVAGVHQEVMQGSWYTHIQFGLSPEKISQREHVIDSPAAGLVPAIHGLSIGKVTKISEDPDGEDRIQVKMPLADLDADGIWARLASLDAGIERGWVFRPEVDDEVVVGFLNGDPRDPIVLGMLHSSKNPSPIPAEDEDNHIKGLVTRSKIQVLFDDEKSIVTIETPGLNTIVIDDDAQSILLKDQHENSITMDSGGITIKASKLTIETDEDVSITAGTAIQAESGTELGITAGTQLTAAGTAGAELSSDGIATIKGAIVQIN